MDSDDGQRVISDIDTNDEIVLNSDTDDSDNEYDVNVKKSSYESCKSSRSIDYHDDRSVYAIDDDYSNSYGYHSPEIINEKSNNSTSSSVIAISVSTACESIDIEKKSFGKTMSTNGQLTPEDTKSPFQIQTHQNEYQMQVNLVNFSVTQLPPVIDSNETSSNDEKNRSKSSSETLQKNNLNDDEIIFVSETRCGQTFANSIKSLKIELAADLIIKENHTLTYDLTLKSTSNMVTNDPTIISHNLQKKTNEKESNKSKIMESSNFGAEFEKNVSNEEVHISSNNDCTLQKPASHQNEDLNLTQTSQNSSSDPQLSSNLITTLHTLAIANVNLETEPNNIEDLLRTPRKSLKKLAQLNLKNNDVQLASSILDDLISAQARLSTEIPRTPDLLTSSQFSVPDTPCVIDISGFSDQIGSSILYDLNMDDLSLLNAPNDDRTLESIDRLLNELPVDKRLLDSNTHLSKNIRFKLPPDTVLKNYHVLLDRLSQDEICNWKKPREKEKNKNSNSRSNSKEILKKVSRENKNVKRRKKRSSRDTIFSNNVSEDEFEEEMYAFTCKRKKAHKALSNGSENSIETIPVHQEIEPNKERIILKIDKTKLKRFSDDALGKSNPKSTKRKYVQSDPKQIATKRPLTNSNITAIKKGSIKKSTQEDMKTFKIPKLIPNETTKKVVEAKVTSATTITKNNAQNINKKSASVISKVPKNSPLFPPCTRLRPKPTFSIAETTQTQLRRKLDAITLDQVEAESTIVQLTIANTFETHKHLSLSCLSTTAINELLSLKRRKTSQPLREQVQESIDLSTHGLSNIFDHKIERCKGIEEVKSILSIFDLATKDELRGLYSAFDGAFSAPKRELTLIQDPCFLWSDDSMNIRVKFTNNGHTGGSCTKFESSVLYIMHNPQQEPNFIALDLNKHIKVIDKKSQDPKIAIIEELIHKDKQFFDELKIQKLISKCDIHDLSTYDLLRNHTKSNFHKRTIEISIGNKNENRFENYREYNTPNRGSLRYSTIYSNAEFKHRLELYNHLLGYDLMNC